MIDTEIRSILDTNGPVRFHLINGENYTGRFYRDELNGYIRLVDISISFPIWAIESVEKTTRQAYT